MCIRDRDYIFTPNIDVDDVARIPVVEASSIYTEGLNILPPGTIMAYAGEGTNPPDGWLWCNGAWLSKSTYGDLYEALKNPSNGYCIYGEGNLSEGNVTPVDPPDTSGNVFRVPDYRGYFLRGQDFGAGGVDPDKDTRTDRGDGTTGDAVGTKQGDALKRHLHYYAQDTEVAGGGGAWVAYYHGADKTTPTTSYGESDYETRPKNIYVRWIIKY